MVIYLIFGGDFAISTCLKHEQNQMETVILTLKILGDFKVFLVIGDLRIHLVMVILANFCWQYGDLSHILLTIW